MSHGLGRSQKWVMEYLRERFRSDDPLLERHGYAPRWIDDFTASEHRSANEGVWHVSLRSIAIARFGESPTKAQIETVRQCLHRLARDEWIDVDNLGGELTVVGINVTASVRGRNALARRQAREAADARQRVHRNPPLTRGWSGLQVSIMVMLRVNCYDPISRGDDREAQYVEQLRLRVRAPVGRTLSIHLFAQS